MHAAFYKAVVIYGIIWLGGVQFTFGAASVSVITRPDLLVAGQPAAVTCRVVKTSDEPEKRIVLRVDLHDADTGVKVSGAILDNNGAGYKGSPLELIASVPVPMNATGAYYFRATAAPWSMNRAIVAHYKTYPMDGTFSYRWPGAGHGVTQDVYYMGVIAAPAPGDNTCYCSGLAFECFVLPFNAYNAQYGHSQIGNIPNPSTMEAFRKVWYGNFPETEKLATRAIPEWGAGVEITDWEEAQDGDFVQFWRNSGTSGHNPLFQRWIRNTSGQITGLRYWGSQGSTQGIGETSESFGTRSHHMNRDRFYIARAKKPRDQADYDWALGAADTADKPSMVPASVGDWQRY